MKTLFSTLFYLGFFILFVVIVTHPVSARLLGIASAEEETESPSPGHSLQLEQRVNNLSEAVLTLAQELRTLKQSSLTTATAEEVWQPCQDLPFLFDGMENLDPLEAPLRVTAKNIQVTARLKLCEEKARHAGLKAEAEIARTVLQTLKPYLTTLYIEAQKAYTDTHLAYSNGTPHGQVVRARGSLAIHPSSGGYLTAPSDHPRSYAISQIRQPVEYREERER